MKQNNKTTLWAIVSLVVLTLIWSFNWVVAKSVLQYVGALDFVALRCTLGALLLLLLLLLSGRPLKPPPWRPVLWVGLFQTAGMTGLSQLALLSGGAGKMIVLSYTMPFWMILLAMFFLGEKMHLPQYIATAVAMLGMLLVIQPWQWHGSLLSSLLAIASGMSWAASSVIAKRAFRYQSVDLFSLVTWQMIAGAIVLLALAAATHKTPIIWSTNMLLMLAYNVVLATALGWTLWLFILHALPASIAGIATLATPAMCVLWAWWLLHERPSGAEAGGIGLILLALALLGMPAAKVKKRRARIEDAPEDGEILRN